MDYYDYAEAHARNRYGYDIGDELNAIREAYWITPYRAAQLAGCSERTWRRWCTKAFENGGPYECEGGMPRERFIAWVRALERHFQATHTGHLLNKGFGPDSGGITRRKSEIDREAF